MDSSLRRLVLCCVLILTLVTTLCLGCGGEEGKVVIKIGHISDMTGPAATALVPINYVMTDLAKYYNDEELIPGVRLEVVAFDASYDPAKDVPGWYWVKDKGAEVVVTALPTTAETLKTFADRDETPLWTMITTPPLLDPPGWVFCANGPTNGLIDTLLEWIAEEDWDWETEGPAKIGSAGWQEPYAIASRDAVRDYAQAHPDQFEWVDGLLAPMGIMTWSGEVQALKDCDFVYPPSTGSGTSTFIQQFREKGYTAKFVGTDAHAAYRDLMVDTAGWEGVDGMLSSQPTRWWNETSDIVDLAKSLLQENHAGEYDKLVHAGIGYIGGFHQCYAFYQVLEQAIEDVGAENFNAQAFYDTALDFTMSWPGYEEWGFSETKRYTWNYTGVYRWSAADEDLVREVTDWLPLVLE